MLEILRKEKKKFIDKEEYGNALLAALLEQIMVNSAEKKANW